MKTKFTFRRLLMFLLFMGTVASMQAQVIDVTGVTVNPTRVELDLVTTTSVQLTANVEPPTATNQNVTWASSTGAATVDNTGLVTVVLPGSAFITATTDDGGFVATCVVTIIEYITSITLSTSSLTFTDGDPATQITLSSFLPTTASFPTLIWTSDDTNVATVDATGLVTPVGAGTATITATVDDGNAVFATCAVTVSAALAPGSNVTGVTLDRSTATIDVVDQITLVATVSPAAATNKTVIWSSSDASVATVSATGVVTAVAEGTAVITVTTNDGSFTATCTVTVTKSSSVGIKQVDNNKFAAYPNPTDGPLTITDLTPGAMVQLFSIVGTQVSTFTAEAETITIDISNLARGMYILSVNGQTLKVIRK